MKEKNVKLTSYFTRFGARDFTFSLFFLFPCNRQAAITRSSAGGRILYLSVSQYSVCEALKAKLREN
jgi:hypothetical protein